MLFFWNKFKKNTEHLCPVESMNSPFCIGLASLNFFIIFLEMGDSLGNENWFLGWMGESLSKHISIYFSSRKSRFSWRTSFQEKILQEKSCRAKPVMTIFLNKMLIKSNSNIFFISFLIDRNRNFSIKKALQLFVN
jgi:hypothetical protein